MSDDSPVDIRSVSPEEHWAYFARAGVALETYTYLDKRTPYMDAGVDRETMLLRHDMRSASGGIMATASAVFRREGV